MWIPATWLFSLQPCPDGRGFELRGNGLEGEQVGAGIGQQRDAGTVKCFQGRLVQAVVAVVLGAVVQAGAVGAKGCRHQWP